jgi:hypothetical protein
MLCLAVNNRGVNPRLCCDGGSLLRRYWDVYDRSCKVSGESMPCYTFGSPEEALRQACDSLRANPAPLKILNTRSSHVRPF